LPQKGRLLIEGKTCPVCGKPSVKLLGKRYRFDMCIDMNCPSKDEWKKRTAEKAAKKAKAENKTNSQK